MSLPLFMIWTGYYMVFKFYYILFLYNLVLKMTPSRIWLVLFMSCLLLLHMIVLLPSMFCFCNFIRSIIVLKVSAVLIMALLFPVFVDDGLIRLFGQNSDFFNTCSMCECSGSTNSNCWQGEAYDQYSFVWHLAGLKKYQWELWTVRLH